MIVVARFLIQTSVERVVSALTRFNGEASLRKWNTIYFQIFFQFIAFNLHWRCNFGFNLQFQLRKAKSGPILFLSLRLHFHLQVVCSDDAIRLFYRGISSSNSNNIVGLVFLWTSILLCNSDKWMKWGQFLSLTFAGMLPLTH